MKVRRHQTGDDQPTVGVVIALSRRKESRLVEKVGLDPTSGRGLEIMQKHAPLGPRARIPVVHADITTRDGIAEVLAVAPKIDWLITEDVVSLFDDRYKVIFNKGLVALGATNTVNLAGRDII